MKGVPVRRVTLPRIPAPPEVDARRPARRPRTPTAPRALAGSGHARSRRDQADRSTGVSEPSATTVRRRRARSRRSTADDGRRTEHAPEDACIRCCGPRTPRSSSTRPTASTARCWSAARAPARRSALLSFYLNDIEDADAAPIVIDPKSELSRICLRMTPPDCGKRVWFLDLGHPAFGMNPLRLIGDRPLAIEAAQIAENIVAALLDINENQIYQSSRRYLYHAVIGAIAIAHREERRAKLEDVYTLLRPAKDDFRATVAEACADQPDLDQTAEFFRSELPDDLRMATSRVAERLDAPRNKISGLHRRPTAAAVLQPPHRHPAAGDHRGARHPDRRREHGRDRRPRTARRACCSSCGCSTPSCSARSTSPSASARACRCSSTRRTTSPAARTSSTRSPPTAPPASSPRSACSTSRSSARAQSTSRRSSRACSTCCRADSCSGWATPQDAEEATRIAMAVYATMIRDDPDSRARLRVTPEQLLNFPNYFCLASWIANGTRAPALHRPDLPAARRATTQWADHHLAAQAERVGPYPEQLDSTLDTHAPTRRSPTATTRSARGAPAEREYLAVPYEEKDDAKRLGARWDAAARSWYIPEGAAS